MSPQDRAGRAPQAWAWCYSLSSISGNDSCGVEADTKYNDTDLCWGSLRRVDAYRIYLVSVAT